MKVISIINLKGGVGKTISAINIAHVLTAVHSKRVLLIDNDKQGNVSKFFGLHGDDVIGMAEVMTERLDGKRLVSEFIYETEYTGLHVITANMSLLSANKEVLLDMSRPQQTRLNKFLQMISSHYDYCIIDNAPDINMSVINALVASDDVLVPIKVDKFAFDGLKQLAEQIEDMWEFNPALRLAGCFITMETRHNVNMQGAAWLENETDYPVFRTGIRKTVKIDETTFCGKPILDYAKNSTAAKDYIKLVAEYLAV
ncbi:MAG: ParA family protein [Defluviitaleaceae bacterium]|nr:ParA family protein [Defluviitaleaceae bacterium]